MKLVKLLLGAFVVILPAAIFFWDGKPIVKIYDQADSAPLGESGTQKINLYYYNSEIDKDALGNIMCSRRGLVKVSRTLPVAAAAPVKDAIELLLKGQLTENEKQTGLATEFPLAGLSLKNAVLEGGTLTLEFNDPQNKTGGGACRAGILWMQIEATAKQFSGIERVKYAPETIFQP